MSIRILALGRPSWFCPSERAFSGQLGHIFNNLPSNENVKNPGEKPLFEKKQMLLDMLTGGFGNLIDIWIFYRSLSCGFVNKQLCNKIFGQLKL